MKDYLLQHDGRYIECELDGLKLTYTCSCDPKVHYEVKLRSRAAYCKLKDTIQKIYESHENTSDAYWEAWEFMDSHSSDEFFTNDIRMMHRDLRDVDEICAYEKEAFDKVWLMRSRPGECPDGVQRVLDRYDDIPENGYTDWDCGYWNGIMGALRWVMGDEKDFLDT